MRRVPIRFLLPWCCLLLGACIGGNSSETETQLGGNSSETSTVTGRAILGDGKVAAHARVRIRPDQYLAGQDTVARRGKTRADTLTDAAGRFRFDSIAPGRYTVEISDGKGMGAAGACTVGAPGKVVAFRGAILKATGVLQGSIGSGAGVPHPASVRVFGLEREAAADSITGSFRLEDLPEGIHAVRISSRRPFHPPRDIPSVSIPSQGTADLGEVILETANRQGFSLGAGFLALDGVAATNPILLDNDNCQNTPDNEYLLAKASLGLADMRGQVVTGRTTGSAADGLEGCREEARLAVLSGLGPVPDPVPGANAPLRAAPPGRPEDALPVRSPGSDLIVAEARKAEPGRPLLVLTGGPLTTVANAWLTDPLIADRMIVFGSFNDKSNGSDTLAAVLVASKCRFVAWGAGYGWKPGNPASGLSGLPSNRIVDSLRAYFGRFQAGFYLGDFAPASFLFRKESWKSAEGMDLSAGPLVAVPAGGLRWDFVNIPEGANDWDRMEEEWFSTLGNAAAYKPHLLPGLVEGEAYSARNGTEVAVDSATGGEYLRGIGAGSWVEYRLGTVEASRYQALLRIRCDGPGQVRLLGQHGTVLAEGKVAGSPGWDSLQIAVDVPEGLTAVRLEASGTALSLDWIRFSR